MDNFCFFNQKIGEIKELNYNCQENTNEIKKNEDIINNNRNNLIQFTKELEQNLTVYSSKIQEANNFISILQSYRTELQIMVNFRNQLINLYSQTNRNLNDNELNNLKIFIQTLETNVNNFKNTCYQNWGNINKTFLNGEQYKNYISNKCKEVMNYRFVEDEYKKNCQYKYNEIYNKINELTVLKDKIIKTNEEIKSMTVKNDSNIQWICEYEKYNNSLNNLIGKITEYSQKNKIANEYLIFLSEKYKKEIQSSVQKQNELIMSIIKDGYNNITKINYFISNTKYNLSQCDTENDKYYKQNQPYITFDGKKLKEYKIQFDGEFNAIKNYQYLNENNKSNYQNMYNQYVVLIEKRYNLSCNINSNLIEINNFKKTFDSNTPTMNLLILRLQLLNEYQIFHQYNSLLNEYNSILNEKYNILKNGYNQNFYNEKEKLCENNINGFKNNDIIKNKNINYYQNILSDNNSKLNNLKNEERGTYYNNILIENNTTIDTIKRVMENNERLEQTNKIISRKINRFIYPFYKKNDLKRGLINMGLTCYMNSTLQCFYYLRKFAENVLKITYDINEQPLISNLQKVFEYKNNYEYSEYSNDQRKALKEFKSVIEKNPNFSRLRAADAKDFILYFMETINQEVNENKNIIVPVSNDMKQNVLDSVVSYMKNKFHKENKSFISDLFYGFEQKTSLCCSCKNHFYNIQIMYFIEIGVEKTYNFVNQEFHNDPERQQKIASLKDKLYNIKQQNLSNIMNNMNNMNNMYMNNMNCMNIINNMNCMNNMSNMCQINMIGNTMIQNNINNLEAQLNNFINQNKSKDINLYDYFRYHCSTKSDNQFCSHCKKETQAHLTEIYYTLPEILVIFLNYGKNISFKCKVDFPEKLDVSQYVGKESPKIYEIKSVICHRGESGDSGHYIAYCKLFNGEWNCFNDNEVSKSYFDACKADQELPYVLFYQKIEG